MDARKELLKLISNGLESNLLTAEEVQAVIDKSTTQKEPSNTMDTVAAEDAAVPGISKDQTSNRAEKTKLSAIDLLFYTAGLILFAALMVVLSQVWDDTGLFLHIFLSLGVGLLLWAVAYNMRKVEQEDEAKRGLANAILLTGSLANIVGMFVLVGEVSASGNGVWYLATTVAFVVLGGMHLVFDKIMYKNQLLVFGVFLMIAAFPSFIAALLDGSTAPSDVWGVVSIVTAFLFKISGQYIANKDSARARLDVSFSSFAMFLTLSSVYIMSFVGEIAFLWLLSMPFIIYAAFMLSIRRRSKQFLMTGTLFLVLFSITVATRYFAGLGIAFGLIVSALAILTSAFVAVNINKKYIKEK